MSHRHVCVHGHFYQPPRENPWTGAVEREEGAAPFHDWNARIAEQCYGPLALGPRAGCDGRTIAYDETLLKLSFNFGPTLLSWLERERPSLLRRVLDADRDGTRPDGLGPALAQPYYHAILPLETRRDKETLVRWGLAEFKHRYGRPAAGMWLPETAVDEETLEVLAREGVAFTILDPAQAAELRPCGEEPWTAAEPDALDPKTPYLWRAPRDPSLRLAVFFYHRRLSRGVASGETTASAAAFAAAVHARFMPGDAAQLVHVASDGEFYGHHRPGAEQVLGLALSALEAEGVAPINHARFLALFPPPREVRIKENTAWSCAHGLGRWESDCGCRSAHLAHWSQEWRAPLREALRRLAARLDAFYEDEAGRFFEDPWRARDESVALLLYPGEESSRRFLARAARRTLLASEEARALRLLALQRERLAMLTSCAWFFDDISGVEAVLGLRRAARALDIARDLGEDAEGPFVERLAAARSNLRRLENGAGVWRRLVAPARVGLERAAAHAALFDHLDLAAPPPPLLRWRVGVAFRAGKAGLAGRDRGFSVRRVLVERPETRESAEFDALVHRADRLDFACWVVAAGPGLDPAVLGGEFLRLDDEAFRAALDRRWGPAGFGLDAVLPDERAELVKALAVEGAVGAARAAFLRRWTRCVSSLRLGAREDDALLALLAETRAHGFLPEELPWAGALEGRLHERLESLAGSPRDQTAVSVALRWLDALWDAGLLTGLWRLRDAQRRWAEALEDSEPGAALDACRALAARLELATDQETRQP